jgi:hypothetical protein
MKDFFKRIFNSLNFDGRDWAVLLLALLLAFSIWIIHNMALKYNDNLQASIVAVSNIDGHAPKSINECQVTAKCRATGYKLLMYNLKDKNQRVEVSFPASAMKHKSGDEYYILSTDLMEYSGQIFNNNISVEYFNADTLFYRFPFEHHKKLPIEPILSISYRQQYMSDSGVVVEPDSVIVYGEPFRIDGLDVVKTEPIRRSDLHTNVSGNVRLETIKGVRMSDPEVRYSIDVVRFTELQSVAPIKTVNVPAGKTLSVYPSVAKIKLKYEFPPVAGFTEDVSLVVDYNEFQESLSGKCRVKLTAPRDGVIVYEVDPPYVECIVVEK